MAVSLNDEPRHCTWCSAVLWYLLKAIYEEIIVELGRRKDAGM
jgi:hypothetical protein